MDQNTLKQIDDKIDWRLDLMKDSLELKLSKEFQNSIKTRFDSAVKLTASVFTVLTVIFTLLGVKTFFDIKDTARTAALDEVKKKLAIDDPSSDFRRDIDKIVVRGLIDSYMISLTKSKQERFPSELKIDGGDLRRIKDFISDPTTTAKDFSDAVDVLLKSSEAIKDDRILKLVRALASASDSKFSWMKDQPEKRAAILSQYTNKDLGEISLEIINNHSSDADLVVSALKYMRTQNIDTDEKSKILLKSKNKRISSEALLTIAHLDFEAQELKDEIDKMISSDRPEDWARCLRAASEIARPKDDSMFGDKGDADRRSEYAATVIGEIFKKDVRLNITRGFRDESVSSLVMDSAKSPSIRFYIPSSLIRTGSTNPIEKLLLASSADEGQFKSVLRSLCLGEGGLCISSIKLEIGESGLIKLANGDIVNKANAPAGITIRVKNALPSSPILVSWATPDSDRKTGILSSISRDVDTHMQLVSSTALTDEWANPY